MQVFYIGWSIAQLFQRPVNTAPSWSGAQLKQRPISPTPNWNSAQVVQSQVKSASSWSSDQLKRRLVGPVTTSPGLTSSWAWCPVGIGAQLSLALIEISAQLGLAPSWD